MSEIEKLERQFSEAIDNKNKIEIALKITKASYFDDFEKSRFYAIEIITLSVREKNRYLMARGLSYLGTALGNMDILNKSLICFKKAMEIFQEINDLEKVCFSCNNLGYSYLRTSNYKKALLYFQQGLEIAEEHEYLQIGAVILQNIGQLYAHISDLEKAMDYYLKALKLYETDPEYYITNLAIVYSSIGGLQKSLRNYEKSVYYHQKSLEIYQKINDDLGIAGQMCNLGSIFHIQNKTDKAIKYLNSALEKAEQLNNLEFIQVTCNNLGTFYLSLKNYDMAISYLLKALQIAEGIGNLLSSFDNYQLIGEIYLKKGDLHKCSEYLHKALNLIGKVKDLEFIQKLYRSLSELNYSMKNYRESLDYFKKSMEIKEKYFDESRNRQINEMEIKYEVEKKQKEAKIAKAEAEMYRLKNIELEKAYQQIEKEKNKTDHLLLTILPAKVALELKNYGYSLPHSYENVTVYISEFRLFEDIQRNFTAEEIIRHLNEIFEIFDENFEKMNSEKIKTFGDRYLAVSGMPMEDENHALNILKAARKNLDFIDKRNEELGLNWEINIGIHSGKVIGGIVGVKKYLYDIFGDTINTAARILEYGQPMKLNFSHTTYNLVSDYIKNPEFKETEVRGKGKMGIYSIR
ncbi:MAG: hypothetical protein APR63_03425 [Desulfuromonas sp. SDB]|nr:MAG: hypothetical protein APR63_03425 [Desulfuromonas sp. SDB]